MMKVGEIWKLNKNSGYESNIPDFIEITDINGTNPVCKICGIGYPKKIDNNGITTWGFSHQKFLIFYRKDYDESWRNLEI